MKNLKLQLAIFWFQGACGYFPYAIENINVPDNHVSNVIRAINEKAGCEILTEGKGFLVKIDIEAIKTFRASDPEFKNTGAYEYNAQIVMPELCQYSSTKEYDNLCFDDISFEVLMVHEMGHLLGLGHSDGIMTKMLDYKSFTLETAAEDLVRILNEQSSEMKFCHPKQ